MVDSFEHNGHRYVREPVPLHFPSEAEVPETKRHLELRTALYLLAKLAFADRALIGCDQFVYWDPTDPSACLAPDLFVRLGGKDELFDSWKVWERGAPHVAVEITSEADASEAIWRRKLEKYRRLGVLELVRFTFDATPLLRVYDHVSGDLVEQKLSNPRSASSSVLEAFWVVTENPELGPMLRLARDADGKGLFPTPDEDRTRLEEELRRRG
jgi:hypothetical protein